MRPSMRILITVFSMIFLANSSLAGEQEDVSKCISAAKRYADVSLGRSNYKYDGGWFNSDVSWHGNTPAFCEVGSKVNKLVISGITYVVDGFAGAQARVLFSRKQSELKSLRNQMEILAEKYSKFLEKLEVKLKNPKPDLDAIEGDFITSVADIKLRILGTSEQLGKAYSSDEVAKNLREEITDLNNKNEELSKDLSIIKAEQRAATPPDVLQLNEEISKLERVNTSYRKSFDEQEEVKRKLEREISQLRDQVGTQGEKIETKYKKELADLSIEISKLRKELDAYKTPIEPLMDEIITEIRDEKFDAAYAGIRNLRELPLYEDRTNTLFVEETLKVVRPIPSSEYSRNLAAYKFLLKLAPDSGQYIEKVNSYEQKIIDAKEQKRIEDIISIISSSDDLTKYRSRMAQAVIELIKTGKCSRAQVKYYGGWVKSGERSGQYFMDCGDRRVWFDPKAENAVYADKAISETEASEMCRVAIKKQTLTEPSFHFFDTSYTVHSPRKAVTYLQGFDVKNAFGTKMKYRAYCLIQPSRSLELSLVAK